MSRFNHSATNRIARRGACRPDGRRTERGFTIIELLIVVMIIGALITIAAPSLRSMIVGNQVRAVGGDLLNDMAISRSESSKRSQRVVMCPSTNQNTCTAGAAWSAGWIAFVDANADQQRATSGTTEPLIRVHDAPPTSVQITTSPSPLADIRFRAIGIIDAASELQFTICPASTGTGAGGRQIKMNKMGRVETRNITCP